MQHEKFKSVSDSIEEILQRLQASGNNSSGEHQFAETPKYLAVAQVAAVMQVSKDYVRKLVKSGHLESVKLPGNSASPVRISVASLVNLLNSSKVCRKRQDSIKRKPKQRAYYGVFSV